MFYFQLSAIFVMGAVFGSFLNVCIYRLPRGESILWPRSYCPGCKHTISAFENIPVLSFLFLRGKCRRCKHEIPVRYPLVEILTGFLLLLVWHFFGWSLSAIHYGVLILFLLPISFIDINTRLILNVLTFPGILAGLLLAAFVEDVTIWQSVIGLLLGGGFLWGIGLLGEFMFKQESMGGGDVKLGAMIGAFLGAEVIIALFLAFFLALPVIALGLSTKKLQLGSKLPFGPFIALAATIIVFWGDIFYDFYFSLFI